MRASKEYNAADEPRRRGLAQGSHLFSFSFTEFRVDTSNCEGYVTPVLCFCFYLQIFFFDFFMVDCRHPKRLLIINLITIL